MEHVSSIMPRAIEALHPPPAAEIVRLSAHRSIHRRPTSLRELIPILEAEERAENPDVVVPLRSLRLEPDGRLAVADLGRYAFTDWSRRQCASLLGLRWDRWFENASAEDRADELNRRFARGGGSTVKVRTKRIAPDGDAAPVVTAFVSPGYQAVSDSYIAEVLSAALGDDDGQRLIRIDVTDRSISYVVAVAQPYRVGGPGNVGDVWGGILVRNSGVGFASLLLVAHLTRLLCKNGMTAPVPDAVILRRRHRGTDGDKLAGLLRERLAGIPRVLGRSAEVLQHAVGRSLSRPIAIEVRSLLEEAKLPQRLQAPILAAYEQEPQPTAFGLSQAATLAAQSLVPEDRLELERAVGAYLAID